MQTDPTRLFAEAVREGRITARSVPRWQMLWASDPRGTERQLAELQPVALDLAARSGADIDAALVEARERLFPELNRGPRGHEGVVAQGASPPSGAFAAPAAADADGGYSWPPPTAPEDENVTVDRNLTAALFPETR